MVKKNSTFQKRFFACVKLLVIYIFTVFADKSLQAKKEFEKANEEITYERNALRERVKDSVNLSEKQLQELYNTMEAKSQRIADMEQELIEMNKKDARICKLEMEIDILQGISCF